MDIKDRVSPAVLLGFVAATLVFGFCLQVVPVSDRRLIVCRQIAQIVGKDVVSEYCTNTQATVYVSPDSPEAFVRIQRILIEKRIDLWDGQSMLLQQRDGVFRASDSASLVFNLPNEFQRCGAIIVAQEKTGSISISMLCDGAASSDRSVIERVQSFFF